MTGYHHCTTASTSPCPNSLSFSSPRKHDNCTIKMPTGDSPYTRAKHVQLVDKDPNKAVPLFWAAINNGDRVDSALKDMAVVLKQLNRPEEAIEAIKSFRTLCSIDAQEPLDNLLLDLYRKCTRMDDQIELLTFKLKLIDEGLAFGGKPTKLSRSQGKRLHVSLNQERSRLLGNLAWAYMQTDNYKEAETLYWQALAIGPDYNKQCNLAICLMQTGRLLEAKSLLGIVPKPSINYHAESFLRSFDRAFEMLDELEKQSTPHPHAKKEEIKQVESTTPSATNVPSLLNDSPSIYFTPQSAFRRGRWIQYDESFPSPLSVNGKSKRMAREPQINIRNSSWDNLKAMKCPLEYDQLDPCLTKDDVVSKNSLALGGKKWKKTGQKHGSIGTPNAKEPNKQSSRAPSHKKVPLGSWKINGYSQNSDYSSVSLSESVNGNKMRLRDDNREKEEQFMTPSAVSKEYFEHMKSCTGTEVNSEKSESAILPTQTPSPIRIPQEGNVDFAGEALSKCSMAMDGENINAIGDEVSNSLEEKAPPQIWKNDWCQYSKSSSPINGSSNPNENFSVFTSGRRTRNGMEAAEEHINCRVNPETTTLCLLKNNIKDLVLPIPPPTPFALAERRASSGLGLSSYATSQLSRVVDGESKKREAGKYTTVNGGADEKLIVNGDNKQNEALYFQEKIPFGVWKTECSQNLNPKGEPPSGKKTWADMVDEDEKQHKVEVFGGEEQFKRTSSFSNKGQITCWADMVEEEEYLEVFEKRCKLKSSLLSFMKCNEPDVFADENVNTNIIGSIPQQRLLLQTSQKYYCMDEADVKGPECGGRTPGSSTSSARRSLSSFLDICSDYKLLKRENRSTSSFQGDNT